MRTTFEKWKPIKELDGLYLISNYGNVVKTLFSNNICQKPKIIELSKLDNGKGYLYISATINNKTKHLYIHRLVAQYFVENAKNYEVVNHIDFNRSNNNYKNLEWCTQKQNVCHSKENMRKPKIKCKETNTGEKYIYKNKQSKYRVSYNKIEKVFNNLSDAVDFRNEVVGW